MSEVPVQVVVAVFPTEQGADQTLYQLEAAKAAGYVGIENAAVVRRDEENKLHIREKKDWGPGKGAAAGAVVGAIIGAVTGPGAILTGAAGAVIGGLAAKLRDSGFKDERLEELGETLTPGTSALVAIIEHDWLTEAEQQLAGAGGEVVSMEVATDLAERLAIDGEVTYTAVGTAESIVTDELPAGKEEQP